MMQSADLIIKDGIILTQDSEDNEYLKGAVAVSGGKIIGVGESDRILKEFTSEEIIVAAGKVVIPGFVNTHFHFTQNFMKGTRDDYDLLDWIDKVSFPRIKVTIDEYKKGNSEIHKLAAMHAGIDLLSSGVTCTTNMEWGMRPEIVDTYKTLKARIVNILTLTDVDSWTPKEAIIPFDEVFLLAEDLIQAFKDTRCEFTYGLACPNSASEKMLLRARKEADRNNVKLHIHLAETKHEYDQFMKNKGLTPTKYIDTLGFWGNDVSAAHSIWLDDEDIDILKKHNVGVAHNPKCNMKIADGAAPITKMLKKGLNVGLGIDSCAVSDNTDFFEAMRTMVFLQRVTTMDPKAVLGRDALKMATIGGARVLGKEGEIGSIETGKAADLLIVDLNRTNSRPYNEIVNNLVFAANSSNINRVIVGGETLVIKGKFMNFDEGAVLDEVEARIMHIYKNAGIQLPEYFAISNYC